MVTSGLLVTCAGLVRVDANTEGLYLPSSPLSLHWGSLPLAEASVCILDRALRTIQEATLLYYDLCIILLLLLLCTSFSVLY